MKLFKTFAIALSLISILSGCYKAGCTDLQATNYDSKMKKDDLSCTYTGDIVFYTSIFVRDSLFDLGHKMLRFELEGVIVDSMATASFSAGTGTCGGAGSKTINRIFYDNTERTYKYRVKGWNFTTIYEGFVTIEANDCKSIKLL